MIKRISLKRICITTLILLILGIIYLFPRTSEVSSNLNYIETDEMPIFLVDTENYVSRVTIVKTSTTIQEQIAEIIETLTINSSKSSYIRDGFSPVIPEGTEVYNIDLTNNVLTIDFSKEFLNVPTGSEEVMIEALVYSLMEIKQIKKIAIYVEGEKLKYLPNTNKVLPEYLDKSYGINKIYNLDSVKDTTKTTIYYISKKDDYYYFVPVTKVTNNQKDKVEIIIQELKTTPIYHTNLISYLEASTNITSYELLEESINLVFDNYLISNLNKNDILEEVKYSIALSLRDTYDISTVIFNTLDTKDIITLF